ncbi:MAG: SUMF1/EgtB/PvdO family nonheme iron enzyme [Myxococcota bacterium]|nr:SUMF1/EgtB/PvdO family nonheme iron enzyme [Myxococcota bacterium]
MEPDEIVFAKPEPGETTLRLSLRINNVRQAPVLISSVTVSENDDSRELSVADADDWSVVRSIAADDNATVTIEWVPLDAAADVGAITIRHNAGPPIVVPVRTSDIDPVIDVAAVPDGEHEDGVVTVTMNEAIAGRFQRARIEATSRSVAALVIERICFIDASGECLSGQTDGFFILCDGAPETPVDCSTPEMPGPLRLNTSLVFSVFYQPTANATGIQGADVVIESNATVNATYKVQLRGTPCVRKEDGDVCSGCGDGIVKNGEACDDGNVEEGDGCLNDCSAAKCGDGILQVGVEACDDGNQDDTDACRNDCASATCGDGVLQADVEACDDGNENNNDACLNTCVRAVCGDGIVHAEMEACDDGNDDETDACRNDCTDARCGDGVVNPETEACDDGNQDDTDACRNDCVSATCGDGIVQVGVERCDDGNRDDTDACLNDCTLARCGDSIVWAGVEACDDGNDNETDRCLNDCTLARCGDGIVRAGVETCDDGNPDNGDSCTNACEDAVCGDGHVHVGIEACDDGNRDETDGCRNDCQPNICGDGVVLTSVEACDDGNTVTETCTHGEEACTVCAADCTEQPGATSVCGDGVVDRTHEACDDDNTLTETCEYGEEACTVCAADCTLQAGDVRFCGDRDVDAQDGEQCDDGNRIDSDQCTNACQNARCGDGIVGPGEDCDGGADCTVGCTLAADCGNGTLERGEGCDDGNIVNGDGCSAACQPDAHCDTLGGQPNLDFVTLPPGSFSMGSPRYEVAIPVHDVRVEAFQLMRAEVTVAAYRCCVNAGACTAPACSVETVFDGWQDCNYAWGREQHPVNFVTWHDAMSFARWTGHRLPSEAEWEYAARSGGQAMNHPWGDQPPTCALADHRFNRNGNCGNLGTSPVCSYPQGHSEQGICDLLGNVYEWTADEWHDSYHGAPQDAVPWGGIDDPAAQRIIRGCNWSGDDDHLHAAWRRPWNPDSTLTSHGFRLARDVLPGCGNAVIDAGEECDGGPGCTDECTFAPTCGNGRLDIGEECDGEANITTFCGDDCLCNIQLGDRQYGQACVRSSECATGLCTPNPHNDGAGECTRLCQRDGDCPNFDRCLPAQTSDDVCLAAAQGVPTSALVSVCQHNETGYPCVDGTDCPIEGVCIEPPNPLPGIFPIQWTCASGCSANTDCPSGYRCDVVRTQTGQFVDACIPKVEDVVSCPGVATPEAILATIDACQNVCPVAERIACYRPVDVLNSGFCTCTCLDANDCAPGFSCAKALVNTGDMVLPGVCTPIAGYRCLDDGRSCLTELCLSGPDWTEAGYCTSACVQQSDCPADYQCQPLGDSAYCEPQ